MKKKLLLLVLLGLCVTFLSTALYAGVEPSPFQPEINQLGAVENSLNSCLDRVRKVLAVPPNPIMPIPDVNGAVNRLEAINGQIGSLNDFVTNTILSVMGVEPSPFRVNVIEALRPIEEISNAIVDVIEYPPNPIIPELLPALNNVKASAIELTTIVQKNIELLDGTCSPYDSANGCDAPCWIETDNAGVNYCCCNYVN